MGTRKAESYWLCLFDVYFYQYSFKAFESIQNPGEKIELPYRLEAPPVSWSGREITEGA